LISRQDYDQIRAEAESLEASVADDRAAVEDARLQLGWCRIQSPLNGRTGSLMAHAGDLIKANSDQPLLIIHQVEPIDVSFTVPEKELPRVRSALAASALPVSAVLPGEEANPATGILTFIDNAVDTRTGTIRLKASFTNADRRLWPGQFVTVLITLKNFDNATVVPAAAVQTGQKGAFVFVARADGTAEMRPVVPGITFEDVTVIDAGVRPGDTVVTDGHLRLYPEAKLDIKNQ
jgi:multidrug efflux system membrane fusion protein